MIEAYYNGEVEVIRADKPGDWMEPSEPIVRERLRGRIDWVNELIRNLDGELVRAAMMVTINPDDDLYFDDKVKVVRLDDQTRNDQLDGVEHSIIKLDRTQDFSSRLLIVWLA
jgi:hypothetical protein